MAFWNKKSDDPWDKGDPAQAAQIPEWYHQAEPAAPPEPPKGDPCLWCGQPMTVGTLYGRNRGTVGAFGVLEWREGPQQKFTDSLTFRGQKMDLGFCEEALYCPACRKLTLDVGASMEQRGPNYTWENGKPCLREEKEES